METPKFCASSATSWKIRAEVIPPLTHLLRRDTHYFHRYFTVEKLSNDIIWMQQGLGNVLVTSILETSLYFKGSMIF